MAKQLNIIFHKEAAVAASFIFGTRQRQQTFL